MTSFKPVIWTNVTDLDAPNQLAQMSENDEFIKVASENNALGVIDYRRFGFHSTAGANTFVQVASAEITFNAGRLIRATFGYRVTRVEPTAGGYDGYLRIREMTTPRVLCFWRRRENIKVAGDIEQSAYATGIFPTYKGGTKTIDMQSRSYRGTQRIEGGYWCLEDVGPMYR